MRINLGVGDNCVIHDHVKLAYDPYDAIYRGSKFGIHAFEVSNVRNSGVDILFTAGDSMLMTGVNDEIYLNDNIPNARWRWKREEAA